MATHNYHAYLLRLWRESEHDPWRAMLENPHTGERLNFSQVSELLTYLTEHLREDDEKPSAAVRLMDDAPPTRPL